MVYELGSILRADELQRWAVACEVLMQRHYILGLEPPAHQDSQVVAAVLFDHLLISRYAACPAQPIQ